MPTTKHRNLDEIGRKAIEQKMDLVAFRKALMTWGRTNFRPFPWRLTKNPFNILIAEVMLHRTQAPQVEPIYIQFIEKYPEPTALASATFEELQKALFSLGLHWRIKMIHKMSQDLQERFGGQIPKDKADLVSLPGVSDYIASAVRCFAWNKPDAIIDTNSVRIVGRLFGLEVKESSRRNRIFANLLKNLIDVEEPRCFNYALLDLAALVCKIRLPKCYECPICIYCAYGTKAVLS
jgi:A/G-specific adenine glycosylase